MERIDRSTLLALVRERAPGFSQKQLKAVIALSPSFEGKRTGSGPGSAYTYSSELIPAAVAYAEAARSSSRLRSSDLRRIVVWLSREFVPGPENRAMVAPAIEELDRLLQGSGLLDEDARASQRAARVFNAESSSTPVIADFSAMIVDFLQTGETLIAPNSLGSYLRRDTINLEGPEPRKAAFDKEDMFGGVLVKFPGLFADLNETTSHLTDEQLEESRPVVRKLYEVFAYLQGERFNLATRAPLASGRSIAQYGGSSEALQTTSWYASLAAPERLTVYVLLSVVRPFVSEYFEAVVRGLPAAVALLAVLRTQFALEEGVQNFMGADAD